MHTVRLGRYVADREFIYQEPRSFSNYRLVYVVWDQQAGQRLPDEFATLAEAVALTAAYTSAVATMPSSSMPADPVLD